MSVSLISFSQCRLLPLYFPRDKHEEEVAILKLPADVGDENGETVIVERKIRIKPLPNVKKNVAKPLQESMDLPVSDVGLTRRLVCMKVFLCLLNSSFFLSFSFPFVSSCILIG